MLKLALLLTVLYLAQAAYLHRRSDEIEQELSEVEQKEPKPFGPKDLINGLKIAHRYVKPLQATIDGTIDDLLAENKGRDEWFAIIGKLTEVMKTGAAIFHGALEENFKAMFALFFGAHDFRLVHKCHDMATLVKDRSDELGSDEIGPAIEEALKEDLLCFKAVLNEAFHLEVDLKSLEGIDPSEEEVLDGILTSFKDLFAMKNDGVDFYMAVHKATRAYEDHEHVGGIHTHFNEGMEGPKEEEDIVARLLRVLKSRNDIKRK